MALLADLKMTPLGERLFRADRNQGPAILYGAWMTAAIDATELKSQILGVWEMAEFPCSQIGQRAWLEMFEAAGFVESYGDDLPDGPVTVYRGCALSRARGFSWTTDYSRAEWFATRFASLWESGVFRVTLPRDRLLAVNMGVDGRGEREVIVNPNRLRGRWTPELVERVAVPR